MSRPPSIPLRYLAGLRRTTRATAGTVPSQGKLVMNRSVPCLSLKATPDCSEPPASSPHSCGTLATQTPNASCGEAFALRVGNNSDLIPTRTNTVSSTFTILFFIQSSSHMQWPTGIPIGWLPRTYGHITAVRVRLQHHHGSIDEPQLLAAYLFAGKLSGWAAIARPGFE
jgi:hypothetical protein